MARHQVQFLKRYHIGKVYKKDKQRGGSNSAAMSVENFEASFDIVSSNSSSTGGSGDELIYEAEAIKVCDQVA